MAKKSLEKTIIISRDDCVDLEEVGVPGGDVVSPLFLVLVILGRRGVVLGAEVITFNIFKDLGRRLGLVTLW